MNTVVSLLLLIVCSSFKNTSDMRLHIIYYPIFHISVTYLAVMYVRMQVFQIES